jgi:hypothetical protein
MELCCIYDATKRVANDIRLFYEAQNGEISWNLAALLYLAANPIDETARARLDSNPHITDRGNWREVYVSVVGVSPGSNQETAFNLLRDKYFSNQL